MTRVTALVSDIRRRASGMGDRHEAQMLGDLAEGLQQRVMHLVEGP